MWGRKIYTKDHWAKYQRRLDIIDQVMKAEEIKSTPDDEAFYDKMHKKMSTDIARGVKTEGKSLDEFKASKAKSDEERIALYGDKIKFPAIQGMKSFLFLEWMYRDFYDDGQYIAIRVPGLIDQAKVSIFTTLMSGEATEKVKYTNALLAEYRSKASSEFTNMADKLLKQMREMETKPVAEAKSSLKVTV